MQGVLPIDDRFELIERVARGAFGEVFRARSLSDGAEIAIKRLHGHLAETEALERFHREAALLSRVQSPHVVRYIAHGTDAESRPWLAVEWLEGEDFGNFRVRDGTTVRDVIEAIRDAALGAAALHTRGITHRDLKPSNVRVWREDGHPRAKLFDLGIAHVGDASTLTMTGMILGSPAYMAPEQVRGEPVDARADVWALGVVLFEALTGETPFGSANAIAVLGKVLLEPVPPLAALRPDLPLELGDLLGRALERSRDERLGSALEFASMLDLVLTVHGNAAALAQPAPQSRSPASDTTLSQVAEAGERRLVALLFVRGERGDESDQAIMHSIESAGGRAERLRDAWLGGFGLARARGDELIAAARAARAVAEHGARVAIVNGWVELRAGAVTAGQLIETGAAILERTPRGEARMPRDTAAALETQFAVEAIDGEDVRLLRERRSASVRPPGAPLLLLGRSVPIVGRDKELRLLDGIYQEAAEERAARLALVIGEAGIGKSRLRHELFDRLRMDDRNPTLLVVRGEPMLSDAPQALVAKGLRETVGLEEGESADTARRKLSVFFDALHLEDAVAKEFLAELLHVPSERDPSSMVLAAREDPALMRQRLRESLRALFASASTEAPIVLAIDDLQWADRATLDLVAWLWEELQSQPVVILGFARPDLFARHPSLWQGIARTELRLAPLSTRASEQIISAVLPVEDDTRRALIARAAGNPLFLEELLRARADGVQELPHAVQSVLQVRLDALGTDARRLAQGASVFGQAFWLEGVAALRVLGDLSPAIAELVRAEIVVARVTSRFAQTTEYGFRHALVRDAAYAMVVETERQNLHVRAANWLERMGERDPALIAQHLEAGGHRTEAAAHFARAARKALGESAYEEAEAYASRAIAGEPGGEAGATAFLLRAEARRALGRTGDMLADAVAARAQAGEHPTLLIGALSRLGDALHVQGALSEADATLRGVLEESHASFLGARVHALLELALVDLDAGRWTEAATLVDEALSWLREADAAYDSLRMQATIARAATLVARGDLAGALAAAESALSSCEATGHRARIAEARLGLARVHIQIGLASEARKAVDAVLLEARALRMPSLAAVAHHVAGMALAASGGLDAAMASQREAAHLGREVGARRVVLGAEVFGAVHRLARGAPGDAEAVLDASGEWPKAVQAYVPLAVVAHAVRGDALRRIGERDQAIAALEHAAAGLRTLGTLDEGEDFVRLAHVLGLDAVGKRREAESALYEARERLSRKAAKLGVHRERCLENVPGHRVLLTLAREWLGG